MLDLPGANSDQFTQCGTGPNEDGLPPLHSVWLQSNKEIKKRKHERQSSHQYSNSIEVRKEQERSCSSLKSDLLVLCMKSYTKDFI